MSVDGTALEVLLVEDDPVVRKSYGTQIRLESWNVTFAADGFEALQAAQDRRFDVVLLDVRTPYKSCTEVLRGLRSRPETGGAAVLLLVGTGDADLVDVAMREGADGVIEKSMMSPREAMNEVRALLESRWRGAAPAAASAAPSAAAQDRADASRRSRATSANAIPDRRSTSSTRRTQTLTRDMSAAAHAVQARLAQRDTQSLERGPPLSNRRSTVLDGVTRESSVEDSAEAPIVEPVQIESSPPAAGAAVGPSFDVVVHRFVAQSVELATALGLPPDLSCTVCSQQIVLRLSPDAAVERGVRGRFYCRLCDA